MKTAYIITMHCPLNYGAILQTYALQTYLESIGLKVEIINYRPDYIVCDQSLMYVASDQYKKNMITRWAYRIFKATSKYKRRTSFYKFAKNELHLTKMYKTYNEICDANLNADYFFCGSDQIWNERNKSGEDPAYYLQFAKGRSILISYAASGTISLPLKEIVTKKSIPMINDLDCISMREDVTIANIQPYINKPIEYVCDPVFLLSTQKWRELGLGKKSLDINGGYVLCYPMSASPKHVIDNAYKVAQFYHLPLYCISASQRKDSRVDKYWNVSPYDFLFLLSNASYVITNSFHGTAFSMIMNKIFWSCEVKGTNHRISSLLNKVGLLDRSVSFDKQLEPSQVHIDYGQVNLKISEFVKHSSDFIKKSVDSVK